MKPKDQAAWMEKNQRINAGIELKRGMEVIDPYGHKGVIVKIIPPSGEGEDYFHGTVYVWQSERTEYGGDNCEHYCADNWQKFLRILDEGVYPEKPRPKMG